MGNGGFITNQSMHWRISHSDTREDVPFTGRDPIRPEWIGKGSDGTGPGNKDHEGFLRVRLRLTGSEGRLSLAKLTKYLADHAPTTDDYVLTIDVPMIPRDRDKLEDDVKDKDTWEVRVDW